MSVFVTVGIRLLEVMFFAGGIGSAVVLILTGIEDLETLLGADDSEHH
ncbi:MAG TPA: hypothetical protein VMT28_10050 [Terriglobales bacterium]|jgi:hypothetical protein|nr:hypothetical protein [Terriglobales bacterium]